MKKNKLHVIKEVHNNDTQYKLQLVRRRVHILG